MVEENKGRVVKCYWGWVYLTPVETRTIYGIVREVYVVSERWSHGFVHGYYGTDILNESDKELCRKFFIR